MLEGALTHIYVYEANSLKRIIRHRCFYLKIRLPQLQMTSTQKIMFKGSSNLQKKKKKWFKILTPAGSGPMISNNLNMTIQVILILEVPKSKTTSGNMFTGIDIFMKINFMNQNSIIIKRPDNLGSGTFCRFLRILDTSRTFSLNFVSK